MRNLQNIPFFKKNKPTPYFSLNRKCLLLLLRVTWCFHFLIEMFTFPKKLFFLLWEPVFCVVNCVERLWQMFLLLTVQVMPWIEVAVCLWCAKAEDICHWDGSAESPGSHMGSFAVLHNSNALPAATGLVLSDDVLKGLHVSMCTPCLHP